MTFLQPFMLLGLAAAVIPVVLHLLTLRRLRTIDFSTLEFLRELQRSRIRRLQVRQWLLLALRTLLVVLLVMAFGRPTLHGTLPDAWGASARSTALILIDDSFSMSVVDGQGERSRRARTAAEGIIRSLREGDEVTLLPFSEQPLPPTTVHAVALDAAASVRASSFRVPLEAVLQKAGAILANSRSANKELYIVSDLQHTLMERSTSNPIPVLQDPAIHAFVVPIASDPVSNVSLTTVRSTSTFVDQGRPFSLDVSLANRSFESAPGTNVSLFLGEERVDQRSFSLNPEDLIDVSLSGTPATTGLLTGRILVEGDQVDFDNSRSFVIRVRQEWRVLLVGTDEDLRYTQLALLLRSDSTNTGLRVETVAPDRLTESRLRGYDAFVVSAGHPALDRWASRFHTLAERGAGLVLLPAATANSWGTFGSVFDLGNSPSVTATGESFIAFRSADLNHPIFEGMFEPSDRRSNDRRQVPTPEIQKSLPMRVPPKGIAVVTLSTGQPFLVEMPVGEGRVIALAAAPSTSWSDLPTQGLFVPLLHRSVSIAAGANEIRPVVVIGNSVSIPVPSGISGIAQIVTPDRRAITVAPTSTPVGTLLQVEQVDVPGVYSVLMEGREVDRFSAVIDDRETDTRASTGEARTAFFASVGLPEGQWKVLEPASDMERVVQEARLGTELWKFFLLAALLVAVTESVVAARRTPVQERG